MHPKVHQSTAFPCPYFINISGAKYSGVPQTEKASLSENTFFLDNPKSVILIYPYASSITFSGFKLLFINQTYSL